MKRKLINEKPETCFGKGYPNPIKKAETIMRLAAKVGELGYPSIRLRK